MLSNGWLSWCLMELGLLKNIEQELLVVCG